MARPRKFGERWCEGVDLVPATAYERVRAIAPHDSPGIPQVACNDLNARIIESRCF